MEIVTGVLRDEWQNQEGSSEKTRRDCREGGHRVGYGVEETSRHGDRLTASSDWPSLLTRQPEDVVKKGSKHLRTVGVYLTTHKPVSIPRCQQLESASA